MLSRPEAVTAVLGLLAFALGVIGLADRPGVGNPLDVAYRALQLFVLDGGALTGIPADYGVVLQVARFAAPAVTGLAIVFGVRTLFAQEVRRRANARRRGHTIVCGGDAAAYALAGNLAGDGADVVLVGPADVPGAPVPVVVGDPREPATLRAAGIDGAVAVYALADSSAANAAVALAAGALRAGGDRRLATYAQVRSEELVDALRVRRLAADRPPSVTIDFFAVTDIAARVLVARHPAGPGTPVVIGLGELGRAVLRVITRSPVPQRRVVVVVAAPSRVREEADAIRAAANGWEVRAGAVVDGDGPVYVCLDEEDETVATGLRLTADGRRGVVACLRRSSPFAEALGPGGPLQIFGVLDEACRAAAIADDSIIGRTARAIHERYRTAAGARNETGTTNPSAVPWDDLPDHLRKSNVAQAEHIGAKLLDIGMTLATRPGPGTVDLTDAEVERLAQFEHLRWKAERERAGFRWGPSRTGREHPDLVDWGNLSPFSRQKDIDAVRHLPALLAAEGLYLRRGPAV